MEKERRGRWKGFLNNKFGQQSIILSLFNEVSVHFIRPFQPKREEEMVIYLIAMETRSRSPFLGCHKLVVRVGFDASNPMGENPIWRLEIRGWNSGEPRSRLYIQLRALICHLLAGSWVEGICWQWIDQSPDSGTNLPSYFTPCIFGAVRTHGHE